MKKIVLSMVTAATMSSVAMAGGDIAPVASAPMDSWSGFYMGLQAGYNWGDADFDVYHEENNGRGRADGGDHFAKASLNLDGMTAGFYAGYNWLLSDNWLVGVEGEWNYLDASDSVHPKLRGGEGDNEWEEEPDLTVKLTQDWEASARLRVGKVMGDYLPYLTGGVAWTSINAKVYNTGEGPNGVLMDDDQILVGWTIGAGVEMAISENIHARIQYRYTDYGDETFHDMINEGFSEKVDYNSHMVTVGLSYRF